MYKKILVVLENAETDKKLIFHVKELAKILHSQILLLHVAEGWMARNYDELDLQESDEMKKDREYLEKISQEISKNEINVESFLALGEPSKEILKVADKEQCDLIAMTSSGHKFWGDLLIGNTIESVRHHTNIPLLILGRGK